MPDAQCLSVCLLHVSSLPSQMTAVTVITAEHCRQLSYRLGQSRVTCGTIHAPLMVV